MCLAGCLKPEEKLTPAEFETKMHRERELWKLELQKEMDRQEIREQKWLRYAMFVCIGLGCLSTVAAYLTKHVKKLGGLALVFAGLAVLLAVMADVLKLVHSWFFLPVAVGLLVSFWLCRKIDLPAWWNARRAT
jgi:hypothetical protein